MLIVMGAIFGSILIYKSAISFIIHYAMSHQSKTTTVSSMKAAYTDWQSSFKASGSVRAIRGVNVTTQLAGMVKEIYFNPGAAVIQGQVLVQLNADTDIALQHSLEANAALAKITYDRDKAQLAVRAVSKQVVDADAENLKSINAQLAQQIATVQKKTIRAPFTGRLGVCIINIGQYLNPGDKITTLQTFDPIYIDFYLPQQALAQLRVGQTVQVTTDTFLNTPFTGKVTTVDPQVDPGTRNVLVEATVSNTESLLTPGMFATIDVNIGNPHRYLTLPQTAISYNPYGDIVYVIKPAEKDKKSLIATQVFVTVGDTRGDQVAILKGLKPGDEVVTSGQLKLRNNSPVKINNSVTPSNSPTPIVPNES